MNDEKLMTALIGGESLLNLTYKVQIQEMSHLLPQTIFSMDNRGGGGKVNLNLLTQQTMISDRDGDAYKSSFLIFGEDG